MNNRGDRHHSNLPPPGRLRVTLPGLEDAALSPRPTLKKSLRAIEGAFVRIESSPGEIVQRGGMSTAIVP